MIGILDSGLGGLSVLHEIRKLLPHVPLHYIADSAHCPYGSKTPAAISERVTTLTDQLIARGASLVVIACNSATIHGVESLRATYPIPIVGMEPGVKPAAQKTVTGTIGVLATEASIAGAKFHKLLATHAAPKGIHVITQPCPDFVTLVEQGITSGPQVADAITRYARPLVDRGADTLVLGCTHYPFLKAAIQAQLGSHITLIDTGPAVAKRVHKLYAPDSPSQDAPRIHISTTADPKVLETILPKLLSHPYEIAH